MKISRPGLLIASILPLAVLLEYLSLVLHLHHALGGWPYTTTEQDLPASLRLHFQVTSVLGFLLVASISSALGAAMVCGGVARWRRLLPYLGLYVVLCVLTFCLTELAPNGYLNWWWE